MSERKISVVIPVLNGMETLKEVFSSLKTQKVSVGLEIIVIDSGSRDGSREFCKVQPDTRVFEIPPRNFNHGRVRNIGAELAKGELVVFLSQDAVPANEKWLYWLAEAMDEPRVAGSYSRHLPLAQHDVLARARVLSWITSSSLREKISIKSINEFDKLSPWEKRKRINFDDVSSCIRKKVWSKFPFKEIDFGEDVEWSFRVLRAGYSIVYEPKSIVFHSHPSTGVGNFKRAFKDHLMMGRVFGVDFLAQHFKGGVFSPLRCAYALFRTYLAHAEKYSSTEGEKLRGFLNVPIIAIAETLGITLASKIHPASPGWRDLSRGDNMDAANPRCGVHRRAR